MARPVIGTLSTTHPGLGGSGLVFLEMTNVESRGRITEKCLGLWSEEQVSAYSMIINECQTYGAKVGFQIAHAGRKSVWRDLAVRKRKTEVPHHLNPVIARGEQFGFDMALTKRVVQIIEDIEEGLRVMSWENIEELRSLQNQVN